MKNNKIDWKRKLSSRKLWAAIAAFVTAVMVLFGCDENQIAQVTAIIMSGATMIAYIIGEGMVDASRPSAPQEFPRYNPEEDEVA